MEEEYILISTSKERGQVTSIANKLNLLVGDVQVKQVFGSETSVDVRCHVNNKKVFLLYNILQPVNESLMQLLFIVDAIKKEGADKIYLITNYLPYTKIKYKTEYKLNFSLLARLLEEISIDKIFTFGLYSPKISFYLKTPLYNVSVLSIFTKILEENFSKNKNLIVSTIDYELQETTKDVAKYIKSQTVFPIKECVNNKTKFKITENVNGMDVLIVSDSIFTGENIIEYSNYLTLKGAKNIYVIATHGFLDKKAIPLIEKSLIKQIYVITHNYQKSEKIKIVPISKIIENIIRRTVDKKNLKHIL